MSATPVIVTVCSAFQSLSVKVSCAGDTVPSVVSELATSTFTVLPAAGCEESLTVKVAVAADSSVSLETAET